MVKCEIFGCCLLGGMLHCLIKSVREIFDTGVNTEIIQLMLFKKIFTVINIT